MSARQCPSCHCANESMTEVAGDLHCLACGYVADVPMEAWDECEAQKDARIAELEALVVKVEQQRNTMTAERDDLMADNKKLEAHLHIVTGERNRYLDRHEDAEAENERLRDARASDALFAEKKVNQAEAVANSSDALLLEATQWAKDARERAEQAEAERDRFSAILDRGLTIMNDKQDIVGTLALRDAAMAYDADLRARADEGSET